MTKFCVFDNNKPASTVEFPQIRKCEGWDNHEFDSFPKAVAYAFSWLGTIATTEPEDFLNGGFDYSGHGDIIEIREVNNEATKE